MCPKKLTSKNFLPLLFEDFKDSVLFHLYTHKKKKIQFQSKMYTEFYSDFNVTLPRNENNLNLSDQVWLAPLILFLIDLLLNFDIV
jgi:hypothetical protein